MNCTFQEVISIKQIKMKLQTLQKLIFLLLTEMFYGAKHWTSLECKLYFLETIVFNDIMEINFT